jgi:probable HAF family extracellular repeat protein
MRLKLLTTSIGVGTLLAAFAIAQQAPPFYTVTDLGVLGPSPGQVLILTNNGLVSGATVGADNTSHAALWYKGFKADIAEPGLGGPNSIAWSVNSRGEVVGEAETSKPDPNKEDFCGFATLGVASSGASCQPFLWQYGVMLPLPTLGGNNGGAGSINNRGEIGGWAENTVHDSSCPAPLSFQFKPVLWEHGNIQELPTVAGDPVGAVLIVNDNGQAAGTSGTCASLDFANLLNLQPLHAVLWQEGSMIDLGNLGGTGHGFGNFVVGLNNLGQAVGSSDLPGDQVSHSFLWTRENGMQDLGTLPGDVQSGGVGINDSGDIVGISLDANFNMRAYLRHDGVMHDLNSLIPLNSPLYLLLANTINNRGEILATAIQNSVGIMHAVVLTPSTGTTAHDSAAPGSNAVQRPVISDDARRLLLQSRFGRLAPRLLGIH